MKKKTVLIPLLLAVLLAGSLMWYFHPRSFDAILPGFRPEEPITACYAVLVSKTDGKHDLSTVEFTVGSPAYEEVMALLRSAAYTRDFTDLLRLDRASDAQRITLEPVYAHFYLQQGSKVFQLSLYGPQVTAGRLDSPHRTYHPEGGTDFQQSVVDLLLQQEASPS